MLLAITWWVSFFVSYWLVLLEVVPTDFTSIGSVVFFLVGACFISMVIHEEKLK